MKTNHLLLGFLLAAAATHAEPLTLSGAAALSAALTKANVPFQQAAGVPVQILSKNAGKGLQDLCSGSCSIAMVTGSLEKAAAGANTERPGSVDLSALKAVEVGVDPVLFVVHPSNPVTSLTLAQIKGILCGEIRNWKDVGGADSAITVFSLGPRNGPRIAVDEQVLGGAAVVGSAIQRETPRDICPIVAQKPNAIGFAGKSNFGAGVKALQTDKPVAMPFLLVTKGAPSPVQEKVIAAAKSALSQL